MPFLQVTTTSRAQKRQWRLPVDVCEPTTNICIRKRTLPRSVILSTVVVAVFRVVQDHQIAK